MEDETKEGEGEPQFITTSSPSKDRARLLSAVQSFRPHGGEEGNVNLFGTTEECSCFCNWPNLPTDFVYKFKTQAEKKEYCLFVKNPQPLSLSSNKWLFDEGKKIFRITQGSRDERFLFTWVKWGVFLIKCGHSLSESVTFCIIPIKHSYCWYKR